MIIWVKVRALAAWSRVRAQSEINEIGESCENTGMAGLAARTARADTLQDDDGRMKQMEEGERERERERKRKGREGGRLGLGGETVTWPTADVRCRGIPLRHPFTTEYSFLGSQIGEVSCSRSRKIILDAASRSQNLVDEIMQVCKCSHSNSHKDNYWW